MVSSVRLKQFFCFFANRRTPWDGINDGNDQGRGFV